MVCTATLQYAAASFTSRYGLSVAARGVGVIAASLMCVAPGVDRFLPPPPGFLAVEVGGAGAALVATPAPCPRRPCGGRRGPVRGPCRSAACHGGSTAPGGP